MPGPHDFFRAYAKRLTLRGMFVGDHLHQFETFIPQASAWLADGSLRAESNVIDGIASAPGAFLSLFHGANTGKLLVRLDG